MSSRTESVLNAIHHERQRQPEFLTNKRLQPSQVVTSRTKDVQRPADTYTKYTLKPNSPSLANFDSNEMFSGVLLEDNYDDPSSGYQSEIILVDRKLPSGRSRCSPEHTELPSKAPRKTTVELYFQNDGLSRPSAVAPCDSITPKVYPHTAVGLRIAHACGSMMSTFRDNYERVCNQSAKVVQSILDGLQTLLDYSQLDTQSKASISLALVKLSRKSGLYPGGFKFSSMDIGRTGKCVQESDHSPDIYEGYLRSRRICFKIIRTQGSHPGEFYKRVCEEAVLWGQLSHPNILPFYGIYEVDDAHTQVGFVLPWMHLGNIIDVLKNDTITDCRLWISDIAAGMAYLHGRSIIHGGLKGGNVLITESRRACLADFGVASIRRLSEDTPNLSSDVYAFADLCYEIFTGERPIDIRDACTAVGTTGISRPPSRYQRTRFLTDAMWNLMQLCWEKDPDRRPTAALIIKMLQRISFCGHFNSGGWGVLSASSFRTHYSPHNHQKDQDLFVVEALQALEDMLAHIAGSHDTRTPNMAYKDEKKISTSKSSFPPSKPLSKLGSLQATPRPLLEPDLNTRQTGQGGRQSYGCHYRPSHLPVSPGQQKRWHDEMSGNTGNRFNSDRIHVRYGVLEIPTETFTSASETKEIQSSTTKADRLCDIVARISSVFGDTQLYNLFLTSRRSNAQTQTLLDLLQELLDNQLETFLRQRLIREIQRLSKVSGLSPKCLVLDNVNLHNDIPLSAGGFADVYKGAIHDRAVCLKVIRLYETPRVDYVLKRFYQETLLWGKLSHPNILPFYGQFRFRAQLSLVSPWMDNGNINDYLKKHPLADRVRMSSEIAAGLSHLHAHDVIHGDLKGANILVSDTGRACLSDFGLSAIIDSQILKWTSHTPVASQGEATNIRWQAPELFNLEGDLEPNSKASDIYAWACVLYEIFTGRLPFFEYRRDSTVMHNIGLGKRPSQPDSSNSAWSDWGLSTSIWRLMEDCWKDDPHERPSIDNILDRLQSSPEIGQERNTREWINLPLQTFHSSGDMDYPSKHEFENLLWGMTDPN